MGDVNIDMDMPGTSMLITNIIGVHNWIIYRWVRKMLLKTIPLEVIQIINEMYNGLVLCKILFPKRIKTYATEY